MKRIRLLVLAGVIAAAIPFGMTAAGVTGGGSANSVSIKDRAQYQTGGTYVEVGLTVKCSGGGALRTVEVEVTQDYPETPHPQGAFGVGVQSVVCDGKARAVAVTVPLGLFDAGKAYAKAAVDPASPTAKSSRWITIVHV
ncbi:MAG TPA: hypothetical protein VL330_11700 [Actinomycetes bacterium]|nr:hypothetical protein [Actinomycetes bacterium]